MKILKPFWQLLTIVFVGSTIFNVSYAQCDFTGLDEIYCIDDPATELVGDPEGGTFEGPGIDGSTFDPYIAGEGVHEITYELRPGGTGDKYYIKSNNRVGPWSNTQNNQAMDLAFGVGEWTLAEFETVVVGDVFVPETGFVFIDGSDGMATELATFLAANMATIEAWVDAGGRLLLNSAPNEGGDIDFGFGGTTLNYDGGASLTWDVNVVDALHPALLGPETPTATVMAGTWYAHALILGVGYTTIIVDVLDATEVVLCEKPWGAGHVMMGGMTTHG
ncbi:hypothetical protein [Crocinitomix catalasitica]|uniref:hypothetical protein n=1 Tax=Crocinitomix catalasitica TaxID=184607 RepID=UPI0004899539|nr:hypothetical protein [Crocinitomix catalasitica]